MKEITVKSNTTGLQVFINDVLNIRLIPKDEADILIAALELQASDFYRRKHATSNDSNGSADSH